jgi:DnaJ family protein A protein 5
LRDSFQDEDDEREDIEEDELEKNEDVEEIEERFKEDFKIQREGNGAEVLYSSDKEDGFFDADDMDGIDEKNGNVEDEEGEEMSVLEAMVSGHRSRKSRGSRHTNEEFPQEVEDVKEEVEVMEYNNRKTRRRGKKMRGWNNGGEGVTSDIDESKSANEETNGCDDEQNKEPASNSFVEDENDGKIDDHLGKTGKSSNQSTKKKGAAKKEANVKSKNLSKGKKGKVGS